MKEKLLYFNGLSKDKIESFYITSFGDNYKDYHASDLKGIRQDDRLVGGEAIGGIQDMGISHIRHRARAHIL